MNHDELNKVINDNCVTPATFSVLAEKFSLQIGVFNKFNIINVFLRT